jgi:uncharacterized protein (TIGR03435 family)
LTVGKDGPRLTPSKVEGRGSVALGPRIQNGQLSVGVRANKTTIEGLAELVMLVTRTPVLDRTGVSGEFDVNISFVPPDINSPLLRPNVQLVSDPSRFAGLPVSGPSLFAALEELGLRLEETEASVEVLVIDRAERPSEN